MRKLGLAIGVVALAWAAVPGPAMATTPSVARCTMEVSLAFSEPIAPLGSPVQEVAITTVTPGVARCEGEFAGTGFSGSGQVSVTGTFTGTCLAHRATGSYSFSHPLADDTTLSTSGQFSNHRAVDRTAFEVRGTNHAGAGSASATVNGNPCRQSFDRVLFVADFLLGSH